MRLVIREYISALRESGELDALLPDLLLAMGMEPLSKPQRGVRQYGVDLAAVGPDPEDQGARKLFLITIKKGDVGRGEWDGNPQAVRPSLVEIIDVYIPTHVAQAHRDLPVKVVFCCGGDLKQQAKVNWDQFTVAHSVEGRLEFDFWGADRLSLLVDEYFMDEHIFPESARRDMRKALALLGIGDYDLSHFYRLLEGVLTTEYPGISGASASGGPLKALRLAALCASVVYRWAHDEDNLKPAYLAAERAVLLAWEYLRRLDLLEDEDALLEFSKVYAVWQLVGNQYFNKVQRHCLVQYGLFGYAGDEIGYPLRAFEVIGILGAIGMDQVFEHLGPAQL